RADLEMPERRVGGDAGAEQGGHIRKRKIWGDLERVLLIHDVVGEVSAVRRGLPVLLEPVIRPGGMFRTVLLQAFLTALTDTTGIHHGADAGQLADVESRYRGSDACHAPDDFMAGDHGEHRTAPLVSRLMDVGVADSAVQNFDEHVVRTQVASLEVEWFERRRRA